MPTQKNARSIIMPHDSFVKIGDEKKIISSIRIGKNEVHKKFQIMLISELEIVQKFETADLNIRIYKDEDIQIDVLEFLRKNKQKIAEIYIPTEVSESMYKDYIKAMMI